MNDAKIGLVLFDREALIRELRGYEVGEEIGRGSWGIVLRAKHHRLGRDVAIKLLPRAFAADPQVRGRFEREARILSSFDHPHIVPVYDYVDHDGLCVLVMELLPNGSVWDRLDDGPLPAPQACEVALATCLGLAYAHARDVLHRDIKPENLLFSASGHLKITDFGMAKVIGGGASVASVAGEVMGTPVYLAPEQILGHPPGPAADVYATAVLLYELLTGELPFPDDDDPVKFLRRRIEQRPIPLGEWGRFPRRLSALVMSALADDPSMRPPSASDLAHRIDEAAAEAYGSEWRAEAKVLMPSPPPQRAPSRARPLSKVGPVVPLMDQLRDDGPSPEEPVLLEVSEPQMSARTFQLTSSMEVGREVSGIRVSDPDVSRRHLRLEPGRGGVVVQDLGSTNGTLVNGQKLDRQMLLVQGDVVQIGSCALRVLGPRVDRLEGSGERHT